MKKDKQNITPITPHDFVRQWNILLSAAKKTIKNDEVFPQVIMSEPSQVGLREKIDFVISRVNPDVDFQKEVFIATGVRARLLTVDYNGVLQVVAECQPDSNN